MTDPRWDRMWDLFHVARERPPAEQAAWLDVECADDPALKVEILRLLSVHERRSSLLEHALPAPDDGMLADPLIGEAIGPYRILGVIGEGGMGIVYEAEQEDPVRRRVALKLIRVGMDTQRVVARFEAERQAVAMMNHPCIARVFDAGSSDAGRPYFVMELVEGRPITEYCDAHELDLASRLELFLQVCSGLRHAHQRGVIHRDIKPTNILVAEQDGQPQPKIIDFGIAKATEHRLTEQTLFTALGEWVGTPEYMSPEQAGMVGDDIDTRTDVYSLGVLLYELLAGALPFEPQELRVAGFDELRRKIREDQPSRPSARLSTLDERISTEAARRRRTSVATLRSQLTGDLDWITLRALEKDRDLRYESVSELAEDIRRHLRNEPVHAGPPSAVYRARKFVRRHAVGVGFASLAAVFLFALSAVMTVQARRVARERDLVALEAATAQQVSDFLVDLFEVSDPSRARGNAVTAREVLDKGARELETGLKDQPDVRARLLHSIGEVYRRLGLYEEAEPLLERSLELRRSHLGEDHPDTLDAIARLGALAYDRDDFDAALAFNRQALEARRRVLGADHQDTAASLRGVGNVLRETGSFEEARPYLEEAVEICRRALGETDDQTLRAMINLAQLEGALGQAEKAEQTQRHVLQVRRDTLGDDHPDTVLSLNDVGFLLQQLGRPDDAAPFLEEAFEISRRVLGDDHRETLTTRFNLAGLRASQGRLDEALQMMLSVLEDERRLSGPEGPRTLVALNDVSVYYMRKGEWKDAEPYCREALDASRRVRGDDHPETLTLVNNMGFLLKQQGRPEDALRFYREAFEGRRRTFGAEHPRVLFSQAVLGEHLASLGRNLEAGTQLSEALSIARRVFPAPHVARAGISQRYGHFLRDVGRYEESEVALLEAFEIAVELGGVDSRSSQGILRSLISLYEAWGRPSEAATWTSKLSS